jgi:hypothetical protein
MAASFDIEFDSIRSCELDHGADFLSSLGLGYSSLQRVSCVAYKGDPSTYSWLDTSATPSFETLIISFVPWK